MNSKSKQTEQISINLLDVISNIWEHKILGIMMIVIFAVLGFSYGHFFIKPSYVSTAKMVTIETAQGGTLTSSDITVATYLAKDYVTLVADRVVLEQVSSNLKLDMSAGQLKESVTVTNPENSRILEISVSTEDPETSRKIANEVCLIAKEKIKNSMGVDKVNIFSNASLPKTDSSPNPVTYALICAAVAFALFVVFEVIFTCFDDIVKNSEDVEKCLGLCTLATIPNISKRSSKKYYYSEKEKAANK